MACGEVILQFGAVPLEAAEDAILAHAAIAPGVSFKKGRRLSGDDVARLRQGGVAEVVVARLDPDDVHEDEAARRLAAAVAGAGLRCATAFTGRVNLHAARAGLLLVDRAAVDRLNARDEAVTLATLPEHAVVATGQMVATVKIIPFAIPARLLEECLALLGGVATVRLAAFTGLRARLIQTELPGTSAKMLDKTVAVTERRLRDVAGSLTGESRVAHEVEALAGELRRPAEVDLILIAGASAITDRRDVLPAAIEAAGGQVLHFGMPVDPGNLMLLGRLAGRPVLGLPGCARSPKLNGFDWVLQRLAAGLEVTPADIMRMGVGGLLMEIPSRPQPREAPAAPPVAPRVAGVVLAAGQSRRMGGPNKLLVAIDGKPMVRRAAEAALAARLAPVLVVTGHMRDQVTEALAGLPVQLVDNPDYAQGLATSLKAGVAALPAEVDAAVVCLGDMPKVTGRLIRSLVQAYSPAEGRAIVVPTRHGKRGNPVLWDRRFFGAMRELAGDAGAKALIGQHEELVAEVETGDEAVLLDVDTPEALARLAGSTV